MIPGSITICLYKNGVILKVKQSDPPPKCPFTPSYSHQINFPKSMYTEIETRLFYIQLQLQNQSNNPRIFIHRFPKTNINTSPDDYLSKVSKEAKKYKLLRYGI